MNRVEDQKGFWAEAKEAFIPDATSVIDLLVKSDIGKSRLLIPVLKDIYFLV